MICKDNLKKLIISGRKSEAVKELRAMKGLGIKEAQEQVDACEKKLIASGELTKEISGKGVWGWISSHI